MTFHPLRTLPCAHCRTPVETRSPYIVCCKPCRVMRYEQQRAPATYAYKLPGEFVQWIRRRA